MNNLSDLTGSIDINIKNKFINNNLNINPNIYVGGEASLNNKLLNSEENNEYILTRLKRKSIFGSESIKDINNDNIYEELIKQNNLLSFVSRTTLNIWGIYLGKLEFIFNGDNNIASICNVVSSVEREPISASVVPSRVCKKSVFSIKPAQVSRQ